METLAAALCGAAIAGVFALIGISLQGVREHGRWVREQRLVAYTRVMALAHDLVVQTEWLTYKSPPIFSGADEIDAVADPAMDRYLESWPSAYATLSLLGTKQMRQLAGALSEIATSADSPDKTDRYEDALERFASAAQTTLKIKA
jgi:hypothetical protein